MNKENRKHTAEMVRKFAADIDAGRIDWIWIASKYSDGMSIKFATNAAPKRPGGLR